jgi:hypothetical protein
MQRILVTIDGGVIQDIGAIPEGVEVAVYDYDTGDGKPRINIWSHDSEDLILAVPTLPPLDLSLKTGAEKAATDLYLSVAELARELEGTLNGVPSSDAERCELLGRAVAALARAEGKTR